MFREGTFNFVNEKLLVNNNSEIQFNLTDFKLHLSEIILHKTEIQVHYTEILLQMSEIQLQESEIKFHLSNRLVNSLVAIIFVLFCELKQFVNIKLWD